MAYYFHWSLGDIIDLSHAERRRWCEQISRINERVEKGGASSGETHRSILDV